MSCASAYGPGNCYHSYCSGLIGSCPSWASLSSVVWTTNVAPYFTTPSTICATAGTPAAIGSCGLSGGGIGGSLIYVFIGVGFGLVVFLALMAFSCIIARSWGFKRMSSRVDSSVEPFADRERYIAKANRRLFMFTPIFLFLALFNVLTGGAVKKYMRLLVLGNLKLYYNPTVKAVRRTDLLQCDLKTVQFGQVPLIQISPRHVLFVSHKWYGNDPRDGEGNFAKWLSDQLNSTSIEYVWVDFLCVDPLNPSIPEIASTISLIPEMSMIVWTAPGYEVSAWCQLEGLISYESGKTDLYNINDHATLGLLKRTDFSVYILSALTAIALVGERSVYSRGRFHDKVMNLIARVGVRRMKGTTEVQPATTTSAPQPSIPPIQSPASNKSIPAQKQPIEQVQSASLSTHQKKPSKWNSTKDSIQQHQTAPLANNNNMILVAQVVTEDSVQNLNIGTPSSENPLFQGTSINFNAQRAQVSPELPNNEKEVRAWLKANDLGFAEDALIREGYQNADDLKALAKEKTADIKAILNLETAALASKLKNKLDDLFLTSAI